jgi:hypothetical protein
LEFSAAAKTFTTKGDLSSREVSLDGWKAKSLKAHYAYLYPMKQLSLTKVTTQVLDGSAEGTLVVDRFPGVPRVTANFVYSNIDIAQLKPVYPWDPKYVVYSRGSGDLRAGSKEASTGTSSKAIRS